MKIKRFNEGMEYTDFFGKNVSHNEAIQKRIRDLLTNIITDERGISEKSFNQYDEVISYVKNICDNNQEIYDDAEECYKKGIRLQFCAEKMYDKYFKN